MPNPNRSNWWRHPGEVERLKASADLVGMIRGHGVDLKPEGADLVGLCPFHREETPSFRVTPSKNLYHCFGCGKGGSAVDWLVATRGVSIREAFESLRVESGAVASQMGPSKDLVECAFEADPAWSDERLLAAVADYYAERLSVSPVALEYLAKRGLNDPGTIRRFRLGYADRTLGSALDRSPSGAVLRERLTALGVIRDSGHEHLNGSLVVPIAAESDGMGVYGMYGRKVGRSFRAGTPHHLYLKGEHRGVFNAAGVRESGSTTVILCEALLDALTFVRWGIENVTSAYGVHGVTPELWRFLTESGFTRVVIAFDADEAGDLAALDLASRLASEGLDVLRLRLPAGHDVNSFAVASEDPALALRQVLDGAAWSSERLYEDPASIAEPEPPSLLAAQAPAVAAEAATAKVLPAAVVPEPESAAKSDESLSFAPLAASIEGDSGTYEATFGDRAWRVKGLSRNRSDDVLRVTLRVSRQTPGQAGFHLDTLDLYQAKSRDGFARAASSELAVDLDVVRADLARLVVALEERQTALFASTREPPPAPVRTLSPHERDEALALLRRPDMLRQLLADLAASGMVGEEDNKLLCWLALTSRHLESPLGVLIQSTSAAGKSSLLDGVLRTMPEEAVVRYSAMSGQALFYMGGLSLKHKILCVAEEEGARRASYSLKLLQSDGELSMASTGKDPESGQLVTKEYKTEGPVALAMTTTSIDVDPELQNRCLVLSVDESREQTEAIHAVQRLGQTRAGLIHRRGVSERLAVWRNAQRLLQPIDVVNPYAQALSFASHRTRTRRDMAKYLTLVSAVALAHQFQKPRHRDEYGEYIEVDLDDIELANRLASRVLGGNLDDLPTQTAELLRQLVGHVAAAANEQGISADLVGFTRRWVRERTHWGDTQLKIHLRRLEELEVLRQRKSAHGAYEYRLWGDVDSDRPGEVVGRVGLLDMAALRAHHPEAIYRGTWSRKPESVAGATEAGPVLPNRSVSVVDRSGNRSDRSASGRGEVRPEMRRTFDPSKPRLNGASRPVTVSGNTPKTATVGVVGNALTGANGTRLAVASYIPEPPGGKSGIDEAAA